MSSDTSGHNTVLFVRAINSVWVFSDLPSKSNVCIIHVEIICRRFC